MPTPSLFPQFLKAQAGGAAGAAGTVFIETFGLEILEVIEIEVVDEPIEIELVEIVELEVVDPPIDIEVLC